MYVSVADKERVTVAICNLEQVIINRQEREQPYSA
jgi:hypothetical protein